MKTSCKSLLPKNLQRRDALNFEDFNIKPRSSKGLRRLIILVFITLSLLGYQPYTGFPPIKQSKALAFTLDTQIQKIEADSIPVFELPHPGYISTRFSRWHPGIDLASGLGMPVHPIVEGIVKEVNFGFLGYGNHVVISHQRGFQSLYGHMGRIYVKKDQIVTTTDTLGTVGLTGFTSGPHTHLEIQRDGVYIDPLTLLPLIQDYPSEEFLKPFDGKEQKESKSLKPDFK